MAMPPGCLDARLYVDSIETVFYDGKFSSPSVLWYFALFGVWYQFFKLPWYISWCASVAAFKNAGWSFLNILTTSDKFCFLFTVAW